MECAEGWELHVLVRVVYARKNTEVHESPTQWQHFLLPFCCCCSQKVNRRRQTNLKSISKHNSIHRPKPMEPITWTSHPLKNEPRTKSACLIFIILTTSLIIGWSFHSTPFAGLSFVLLTAAMSRYFLPTRYTLNNQGITLSFIGSNRTFLWSQFSRADQHNDGIFLSPFNTPHRLDTFRGQFLKTGVQTKEIFHVVQQHLNAQSP